MAKSRSQRKGFWTLIAVAMTIGFLASITASTLEPDEPTLEQKVVFVTGAPRIIVLLLIAQVWLYHSREIPERPSSDHGVKVFQDPVHWEDVDVAARQSPAEYLWAERFADAAWC
jgi:hypothetical protein